MVDWRPMSEFDPSKPALAHDKLNDQVTDWEPAWHGKDYKAGQTQALLRRRLATIRSFR